MKQGGYFARRALALTTAIAGVLVAVAPAMASLPGELGDLEHRLMSAHSRADAAELMAGRHQALSLAGPGEEIGAENYYMPGVAFYTDMIPTDIDKHHDLVKFVQRDKRVWFVLKEKNHVQLYTLQTKPYCMKPSYMVHKVGKRALATNMVPEDGKYMLKRQRTNFD